MKGLFASFAALLGIVVTVQILETRASALEGGIDPEPACTMALNSMAASTQCATGYGFSCSGLPCCHHEHQGITWNNLVNTGGNTGKKAGAATKKYYEFYLYECVDHDNDPGTEDECRTPFSAPSQDSAASNPTHFVNDWSLVDCD